MYTGPLMRVGGALILGGPLEMLQLESGIEVTMTLESGRLVDEPCAGKKYNLQELLAQCDASVPLSGEDSA